MENYNGLASSFGTHTVRVNLQDHKYKGYFDMEVDGNCKGLSAIDFDFGCYEIDNLKFHNLEISYDTEYDCFNVTIYDGDNHEDWIEVDELEADEINQLIVGIEIIDFKEDK